MAQFNLKRFFAKANDDQIKREFDRLEAQLQQAVNWQAVIRTNEWSVVRAEFEATIKEMAKVLRTNDLSDEKQRLEAIIAQRILDRFTKLINASMQGAKVAVQEKVVDEFKQQLSISERQKQ